MECRYIVLSEITYNGTNYNLLDRYRNSRIKNAIISGEIKGDVVTDDGKILYYKVPLQVGDTFKATDGWFTYHLNDIINNQLAVMDGWDYCIDESTYLDKYPITLFIGVKAHYDESLKMKEYLHRQLIRRMNERGAQDVVKSLLVNSDSLLKKNFARYGITDTGYTFSNKKWKFGKHEIRNLQSVSYRLTRELKILNELNIHYLYETIERFKIECDALINDYNTKKRIGLPEHMVLAEKHMEYYIDSILSEAKSLCNDCGCRNIKYYLAKYSKSTYFRVIYDIMDKVYDTVRKNIHINNYEHYRLCNKYEIYNSRIMDLVSNFNDYLEYNDIPDNRFCNHALAALHQYSLDLTTNPNITVDLAHNTVNIQSLLYIDSLNIANAMIEQIEKWQVLRQQRLQLQKERLAKEREQKKAELDAKKKVGIDKLKELISQIEEIDDESSMDKLIDYTNCLNTAKALMIDMGMKGLFPRV